VTGAADALKGRGGGKNVWVVTRISLFHSLLCFIFISNTPLLQRFSTGNIELPNNTKGCETIVDMAGIKKPAACGTEENTTILNGFFCELLGSSLRIYVSLNQ
jgi:hypothetical protein